MSRNRKIKYLEINDDMNVFVVGDIHGCYSLLMSKLKEIGFNFNQDLLISVGDYVDRGVENEKCFSLLQESWFVAIKGNHEDFCYQGLFDDRTAYYHRMQNNGGDWFYKLDDDKQEHIARIFNDLALMLEVSYRDKKFGFVHADLPVEDWELVKEMLINDDDHNGRSIEECLMWSRGIISRGNDVTIAQVDNVFFGHTVLPEITQLGNCTFLDTGGVFKESGNPYDLSVVNLKEWC